MKSLSNKDGVAETVDNDEKLADENDSRRSDEDNDSQVDKGGNENGNGVDNEDGADDKDNADDEDDSDDEVDAETGEGVKVSEDLKEDKDANLGNDIKDGKDGFVSEDCALCRKSFDSNNAKLLQGSFTSKCKLCKIEYPLHPQCARNLVNEVDKKFDKNRHLLMVADDFKKIDPELYCRFCQEQVCFLCQGTKRHNTKKEKLVQGVAISGVLFFNQTKEIKLQRVQK